MYMLKTFAIARDYRLLTSSNATICSLYASTSKGAMAADEMPIWKPGCGSSSMHFVRFCCSSRGPGAVGPGRWAICLGVVWRR